MQTTLLVDGDNLLTIGFYGLKNHFYKGVHIGAIFHFLNTLRRTFELYHLDKIVVFWDGDDSGSQRRAIYPFYKGDRKGKSKTDEEIANYDYQRNRVKQYLEEIYARQGEYKNCETDDTVAFYTQNSPNEKKIIFSSDGDLTQLVSANVQLYNPAHHKLYNPKDTIEFEHETVLIENVGVIKMICGDKSDSITGIKGMGITTFKKLFPEVVSQKLTIDYVRQKSRYLMEQENDTKVLQNLLNGETKFGVLGEDFFEINHKIIDLSVPFLTDEARDGVISLINDDLDTEGRSYKNTMKMMMEDGIFTALPKSDDAWLKFLTPFLKLTRKEKNKHLIRK